MITRRSFLAGAVATIRAARAGTARPLTFAVISDVQYADRDTAGRRNYRASLEKLEWAVAAIAAERPSFTIQLGDLVDGGAENLTRIGKLFERIPAPRYHVLGNHDFFRPRQEVMKALGLRRAYYRFRAGGWEFAALDGMNASVNGGWAPGSAPLREGRRLLDDLRARKAVNAYEWNGAVGAAQRNWLASTLRGARGRRAVVFCHFPVFAGACRPEHLLWDHEAVLRTIEAAPRTAAWICGHDHTGGYAERAGIHHVTMAGVVENEARAALRFVDAHADRLVLRAPGQRDGRELALARR